MIPFCFTDPDSYAPFSGFLSYCGGIYNGLVLDQAESDQGVRFIFISEEGEVTFKKLAYATD